MTEPPGLFDLPDPQEEIATSDAAAIRWWIEPAVGLWPQLADTPDLPRCSGKLAYDDALRTSILRSKTTTRTSTDPPVALKHSSDEERRSLREQGPHCSRGSHPELVVEHPLAGGVRASCLIEVAFGEVDADQDAVCALAQHVGPHDRQCHLDGEAELTCLGESLSDVLQNVHA